MKLFFKSLEKLNKYVSEVRSHSCCPHCSKKYFLISHGFVYKKTFNGTRVIIGKRIFCSNRLNRLGCGRTFQIYLSLHPPKIHYHATHLNLFINSLTRNESIHLSYLKATGCNDSRNAYRWLKKLDANLIHFRDCLCRIRPNVISTLSQHRSFGSPLASTLFLLLMALNAQPCQRFQELTNKAFL